MMRSRHAVYFPLDSREKASKLDVLKPTGVPACFEQGRSRLFAPQGARSDLISLPVVILGPPKINLFPNVEVNVVAAVPIAPKGAAPRVRVFVDYWNLQLTMNSREEAATGQQDVRFKVDWRGLPSWLARKAAEKAGIANYSFEGGIIFASYDPKTQEGSGFNSWATNWLNRQPGIQVQCHARQMRGAPRCNVCHQEIAVCPHAACGSRISGTIEKGVDTAIVTDMIRLAWEDAYDIAVLASSDADLIPAVKFLDQKGRKVIQAGLPPSGVHLATACWASFDIFASREEIRRP